MSYYDLIDKAKQIADTLKSWNISSNDFYVDDALCFWILCRDLFEDYGSDSVKLTLENLPVLRASINDAYKLNLTADDGLILFCCRERKQRPRNEIYNLIAKALHPALDECEPKIWISPLSYNKYFEPDPYGGSNFDTEYVASPWRAGEAIAHKNDNYEVYRPLPWYKRLVSWLVDKLCGEG